MAKLTEEMKRFISTKHMDEEKGTADILKEFGDSFGFLPSASTITKYQLFNESNPPKEEEEEEEEEGEEGTVTTKQKDTRLTKELVDFSDGIETEDLEKLCRTLEKSKSQVWELLAEATRRGYTKVDLSTGEIEK